MPTTRRKSANAAASSASKPRGTKASTQNQTKLAFHGQVSKQSVGASSAEEKAHVKTDKLESPATAAVEDVVLPEEPAASPAIEEDAKQSPAIEEKDDHEEDVVVPASLSSLDLDDEERPVWRDAVRKARGVSDARIESYWKERDAGRITERVHQEGMGLYEKMLGDWDIDSRFGVSALPPRGRASC
jgi:hypothetical protein